MRAHKPICLVLVAILLALTPINVITAQTPSASPVRGGTSTDVLAEFVIDELPTPYTQVMFLRTQLGPYGESLFSSQPGPILLYDESGTLVVEASSAVSVLQAGVAEDNTSGDVILEPGDSVLVPANTSISWKNPNDQAVTFLMLFMVSGTATNEDGSSPGEIIQIAQNGLAAGSADFLPGPATITLERIVIEPGQTLHAPDFSIDQYRAGWSGLDIGWVETGSANLEVEQQAFSSMVWRVPDSAMSSAPEMVPFAITLALEQGEGFSMFDARLTWTAAGDEPLTILRVIITPNVGP